MIRYITKHALTQGIIAVEGEYIEDGKYFTNHGGMFGIFVRASEAFETLELAQADAKKRADKKAKSALAQARKFGDPKWQAKVLKWDETPAGKHYNAMKGPDKF